MEEVQQLLKYVCKFCSKSFPCGRSLGGHMRSHLTNNPAETAEKLSNRITKLSPMKNGGTKSNNAETSSSCFEGGPNQAGYGLRENPKKTCRFAGSSEEASQLLLGKFCKECGKGFQSWKALFGHMKSHSERERASATNNNSFEEHDSVDSANQKMVLDSQSDNETTTPNINEEKKKKKKRSQRRIRYMGTSNSSSFSVVNNNNNNASSSLVSETEQEQEEVAMCLIMLSRDASHWSGSLKSVAESSDNFSGSSKSPASKACPFSTSGKTTCSENLRAKKVSAEESENCASGFGKLWSKVNRTEVSTDGVLKKDKILVKQEIRLEKESELCQVGSNKLNSSKRKLHDGNYENEFGSDWSKKPSTNVQDPEMFKNPHKRSKFECTTCNKIFHSYQALGGHRASHKKSKGCFASITNNTENSIETDDDNKPRNHFSNESFVDQDMVLVGNGDGALKTGIQAETSTAGSKKKSTKGHECPICLKVFASGQALGGHKRSHLISASESKQSKVVEIEKPVPVPEIRDFLDLNLPAPDEEDSNGQVASSLNPWWAKSTHKHEALVGLISN